MRRREFLCTTLTAGAASLIAGKTAAAKLNPSTLTTMMSGGTRSLATDSRIEILLDEPIGRIAPEIYGHFVEHLGGVVYDGIWVGEGSKIANTGGIRQALVDAFRKVKPAVVRWPGGCFAD